MGILIILLAKSIKNGRHKYGDPGLGFVHILLPLTITNNGEIEHMNICESSNPGLSVLNRTLVKFEPSPPHFKTKITLSDLEIDKQLSATIFQTFLLLESAHQPLCNFLK